MQENHRPFIETTGQTNSGSVELAFPGWCTDSTTGLDLGDGPHPGEDPEDDVEQSLARVDEELKDFVLSGGDGGRTVVVVVVVGIRNAAEGS